MRRAKHRSAPLHVIESLQSDEERSPSHHRLAQLPGLGPGAWGTLLNYISTFVYGTPQTAHPGTTAPTVGGVGPGPVPWYTYSFQDSRVYSKLELSKEEIYSIYYY